eukprot:UC4_evm1s271
MATHKISPVTLPFRVCIPGLALVVSLLARQVRLLMKIPLMFFAEVALACRAPLPHLREFWLSALPVLQPLLLLVCAYNAAAPGTCGLILVGLLRVEPYFGEHDGFPPECLRPPCLPGQIKVDFGSPPLGPGSGSIAGRKKEAADAARDPMIESGRGWGVWGDGLRRRFPVVEPGGARSFDNDMRANPSK